MILMLKLFFWGAFGLFAILAVRRMKVVELRLKPLLFVVTGIAGALGGIFGSWLFSFLPNSLVGQSLGGMIFSFLFGLAAVMVQSKRTQ